MHVRRRSRPRPSSSARELHRGGEARVEVDVRDVVGSGADVLEGSRAAGRDRGRAVEALALGDVPLVGGGGSRVGEHPALGGDAEPARDRRRADDHGSRLVDLDVGVVQLAVGVGDQPVLRPGGDQLLGRVCLPGPCARLLRGDLAEVRPQRREAPEVLLDRLPGGMADRVLDQGVGHDRGDDPDLALGVGARILLTLDDLSGAAAGVGRRPVGQPAVASRARLREERLAPADDADIELPRARCARRAG